MSIDMSRYLGLFVTESTEHLELLGRDLVAFEKNPGSEVVDSMFRHAHSVKGMASSMGLEAIAVLAHRVEDLVDAVRSDPGHMDRELVDLLLASTDTMLGQTRAVGAGQTPEEATSLLAALSERVERISGKSPAPTRVAKAELGLSSQGAGGAAAAAAASQDAPEHPTHLPPQNVAHPPAATAPDSPEHPEHLPPQNLAHPPAAPPPAPAVEPTKPAPAGTLGLPPRFSVKLRIAPTCQAPGVRAFLVHKRLTGAGNVFNLKPPLEDLKAGRIHEGLISLELETSGGEAAIQQALGNVSEVEILSVRELELNVPAPIVVAPSAPAAEGPKVVGAQDTARTVRVRTELLDYFLDAVGELLLATARIREVGKRIPENVRPALEEGVDRLHMLVKDLHDKVMSVRMTPLSVVTDRLPRAARDIARKREREVDLVITGAEIELDRAILDELADPLLHLLRNCIDHGIESPEQRAAAQKGPRGRVLVSVKRQRDRVILEMEDDGRGMSAEKLKSAAITRGHLTQEAASRLTDREAFLLACLPGVSTARDVSDISGRGVGMDAVKRSIENVGGTLEIESELGRGTRFILRLPLTVAVVQLLLVKVGEEVFGLPIAKVVGAVEADEATLSHSRETPLLAYGTGLVPVHSLGALLEVPQEKGVGVQPYVVMESEAGRVGLRVDGLLGQEEVVLKALSRPLDLIPGLAGVTILGSGRPVFILDVPRLLFA